MRLQILFTALLMVSVSVRSGAFAAEVKDYYEITDLETGARVQVPFVNNQVTCTERVLGKNDAKSVFYALRETNREFTLRTISYDGNVLEETRLADFRCQRYNDDFGALACCTSPKGEMLLFWGSGDTGVALYEVATGNITPLVPQLNKGVTWMNWLSDRSVIICIGGYKDPPQPYSSGFVVADIQTKQAEQIYQDPSLVWGGEVCALSPDQRYVAFFARKAHHVQVLDLNSREVITVTPREELSVRHLCWSPDTKLLAYEVETRGRIKVYSIAERKEVLIKEQGADLFIPASMFFLDAERLAVQPHQTVIEGQPKDFTECGPSGIVKAPVVALRISTGEVERPFPEEFYGVIRPIAGGRKFLGIADDDRDWFSAAGAVIPPPGVSLPGVVEEAAPSLIEGVMWAAAALFARPPKIAIFDCDSGNKSVVKPPHRNREMITRVDNAKGCFQTTVFGDGKLEVRTISLTGEITENRECPIDVPWMDPRESAWSESGDALLYRDFRTLKLWSFTQNREETILSDMELIISHISWLSPTEALMVISEDSAEAATWSNTIAKVHLDTKQLEELYRGVSLFHMRCALSPGHRYFAFVDEVSKEMYWDELRMLDLQTKQLTTLVSAKEGAFLQDVCWSPDGSSIVYAYGMRTGYAPGRSPEDQEKLKKEMETGKLDPDEAMKLLQAMSGPMYEVEDSINLMSLADKQPVKLLVLPKDAACHEIQFSGPDRIAYRLGSHVGDGAGHGTSINVFNLKSRQQERRIETKSKGRMWATADGRRILLEGVMD